MKDISFKNNKPWVVLSIALVVVIFYLVKCRKTPVQPEIKSEIVHDTIAVIKYDNKKISDSFETILKRREAANYQNESDFIKLLNENSELAAINSNLQKSLDFPDTCLGVVNKLNSIHGNYVSQTNKTLDQAKKSLVNLAGTIKDQKAYLSEKDNIIKRALSAADSCQQYLKQAENYNKKVKPKHEISLIVSGINDFSNKKINPSIGAGLGYRNKRGLEFYATYYTNGMGSIGIKKPLVKF